MDKILIQGLKVDAILGVYERERVITQPVQVDLTLFTNEREPDREDVIDFCVDYEKVSLTVRDHIIRSRKMTVEALAEEVAEICLSMERVREVTVRVLKTNAIGFTNGVGVEIHRINH